MKDLSCDTTVTARQKAVEVQGVSKRFGSFAALRSVSFDIYQNEFFTMLGPSGCGKTTLLRMIAGFEHPTEGRIRLHGQDIGALPPHRRRVNTVFQSYALFPHMTLEANIAFPLENLGWPRAQVRARVARMLDMVGMRALAGRKPAQLSGGQRQRIALARALAPEPEVLLLDEPLSALDLKLRQAMRDELRALQRATGITFVFVTHDQEEALEMSDRICVLGHGEVQQIGRPDEIYEEPDNRFVADFIGETNFLDAEVLLVSGGLATVSNPLGRTLVVPHRGAVAGQRATLSLRPDRIALGDALPRERFEGRIVARRYMGGHMLYLVEVGEITLKVSARDAVSHARTLEPGSYVQLGFNPENARVLAR